MGRPKLQRPAEMICGECAILLPINSFDLHRKICRSCRKAYGRLQYKKNAQSRRAYTTEYRRLNPEKIAETKAVYRTKNLEKVKAQRAAWGEANRDHRRQYERLRSRKRMQSPISRLIAHRRSRRSEVIQRRGHTLRDLGCTVPEWKTWLESKFWPGMTWENYGSFWHLDEIIPVSAWNLAHQEHWQACWHWTNSQPLPSNVNLSKGGSNRADYSAAIPERLMVLKALEIL